MQDQLKKLFRHIGGPKPYGKSGSSLLSFSLQQGAARPQTLTYQGASLGLVVDGKTLEFVFENIELQQRFLYIAQRMRSVVANRLAPAQKAQLVNLVKSQAFPPPLSKSKCMMKARQCFSFTAC